MPPVVVEQDWSSCPFVQPASKLAEPVQMVLEPIPPSHLTSPPLHSVSQFWSLHVPRDMLAAVQLDSSDSCVQAEDAPAAQLKLAPEQTQDR